jgi:hypothetical protein
VQKSQFSRFTELSIFRATAFGPVSPDDRRSRTTDGRREARSEPGCGETHVAKATGSKRQPRCLSLAASQQSMELATRENALTQSSLHDLPELFKKITRNEKIA